MPLFRQLVALLGADNVLNTPLDLDFYSSDVFDRKLVAELVLRPTTVEHVSEAVRLCTNARRAVIPRGGGLSYTGGYLPIREQSVIIDLARLDRIVEINREDMYVTLECGVTWHQLHEALQAEGLRTPYWGTVSGYHATIGGGLSQGSTHFGSAEFGASGDSCLGLEVVVADGALIRTGSASNVRSTPFFRGYGPDLTGLFLNDCGALGFKVRATLKLIEAPQHQRYASAAFERLDQQLGAMAQVARSRLASECGGWDPSLVRRFGEASIDLRQDLQYLASVAKSGKSLIGGVRDAARIALAGRRSWKDDVFLMHVTIDEFSSPAADEKMKAVEKIIASNGGRLIPASYPRAHRALPFTALSTQRREAERTVPTHAICPHSRAVDVAREVYGYFDEQADLTNTHGITWSLISSVLGTTATLIEPLIHYPDARGAHYARIPSDGASPGAFGDADEAVIEALRTIRRGLVEIFRRNGCSHLQIGKSYPYRASRDPAAWALLESIKAAVDPGGLINPGSLGLNAPAEQPVSGSADTGPRPH